LLIYSGRAKSPATPVSATQNRGPLLAVPPITRRERREMQHWLVAGAVCLAVSSAAGSAVADGNSSCSGLPSQAALETALHSAVNAAGNNGLGFNMWGTLVAQDGTVCAVAFSGNRYTDQWLASRVISAQKANTANGLSLGEGSHMPGTSHFPNGLALSTANLYSAVQPGGS